MPDPSVPVESGDTSELLAKIASIVDQIGDYPYQAAKEILAVRDTEMERLQAAYRRDMQRDANIQASLHAELAGLRERAIVLHTALSELAQAVISEVNDPQKGAGGYLLARLADARDALKSVGEVESWRAAPEPIAPAKPRPDEQLIEQYQQRGTRRPPFHACGQCGALPWRPHCDDCPDLIQEGTWKRGDRVTWTDQFGVHFGVVVEDQVGMHVRVQPDNTNATGSLLASSLTEVPSV